MKPFRGKRRGPQSPPVGFSRSVERYASQRIRKGRTARRREADRCTSGERSAKTGSPAVRSPRERWPDPQGFGVIGPGGVGPPADRGRRFGAAGRDRVVPFVRSNCGDCRQCPLTAVVRRRPTRRSARGRWRIGRSPVRPVLKHGPRSLTCARVIGCYETYRRSESKGRSSRSARVGFRTPLLVVCGRTTGPSRPQRW